MPEQKCKNCRFFDQHPPNSDSLYDGLCLRYPPQLQNNEHARHWYFPEVRQSNCCGEWKPILKSGNLSVYDEE